MKVVWRLTKERLSGEAFNGDGAKRFGGRWNNEGTPVAIPLNLFLWPPLSSLSIWVVMD